MTRLSHVAARGRCVIPFCGYCIVPETSLRPRHRYVIVRKLLASIFNIDGNQHLHTGNVIEHTGPFRNVLTQGRT
jgi:hypothetical protein